MCKYSKGLYRTVEMQIFVFMKMKITKLYGQSILDVGTEAFEFHPIIRDRKRKIQENLSKSLLIWAIQVNGTLKPLLA